MALKIERVEVRDIRFPTSKDADGSDAMHTDPDYSCAYVVLHVIGNEKLKGHGLAFTLGRGTEIVVQAVKTLTPLVVGQDCHQIWNDFGSYWRQLTSETQIRWVGPEKGVLHLAVAAIVNALWDLWARYENKPLWKLLVDLSPEKLVSTIDFRYITDAVTPQECINMLKEKKTKSAAERENEMRTKGFQAYTTQAGWLGYSDDKVNGLCKEFLKEGFTSFKVKVGQDLNSDKKRCKLVRDAIGASNNLMIDANQRWGVQESIDWVTQLKEYKPLWIEEPTSPDDILGHATIANALRPLGIGVATGEMCENRVIFKQLLQAKAISFCQIDSCRLGGVNEVLSVYFMAKKFGVPVCPHAGGVGLCEMVQHLQMWDYISLTGESENRMVEWVDHLHEHFTAPPVVRKGHYIAPTEPGYSTEMKNQSLQTYEFPSGKYWSSQ
jgi:L-fuconate dehydratase